MLQLSVVGVFFFLKERDGKREVHFDELINLNNCDVVISLIIDAFKPIQTKKCMLMEIKAMWLLSITILGNNLKSKECSIPVSEEYIHLQGPSLTLDLPLVSHLSQAQTLHLHFQREYSTQREGHFGGSPHL